MYSDAGVALGDIATGFGVAGQYQRPIKPHFAGGAGNGRLGEAVPAEMFEHFVKITPPIAQTHSNVVM